MLDWQISVVIGLCLLLPTALGLLGSEEVRRALRGAGSVRQTLSNASVGAVFLLAQVALRGVLLGAYAALAALVPWKLPTAHVLSWLAAFLALEFI